MSQDRNLLLDRFVAQSPAMLQVLRAIFCYSRARTLVTVIGATGTGKTTVAELIHALSGRPGMLSAHTAGEFDRGVEQSQIFGHERGAFTGAVNRQLGVLEEAGDGTLLLDDFHHLRRSTQTSLLRVLDRGSFRRLGSNRDLPLRARIIIGLTHPPDVLVERGTMLLELRSRLGYSTIHLPPLCGRREDIQVLASRFLERCPEDTGVPGPKRFAPDVVAFLQAAAWPGNVRQLEMVVRDAYLRARNSDMIYLSHLSELIHMAVAFERRGDRRANARAVRLALEVSGGQIGIAAKMLRTSRNTIYHYLNEQRRLGEMPGLLSSSPAVPELNRSSGSPA